MAGSTASRRPSALPTSGPAWVRTARWIRAPRTSATGPAARCTASSSARSRRWKARAARAYDYPDGEIPFAMKLDMARQCWDEARHVEISVKLGDHMGTEIGEYSEAVTLFEAACHPDAVFRLAGVNRALEGLAIDVFTTMRDFADDMDDPVLAVQRGLDAGRRGHPREDGLDVAPGGHEGRRRPPPAAPSSSRRRSMACSTSGACAERTATRRSASPGASVSWPGSTPRRSTPSPRSRPPSGPTGSHRLPPEPPFALGGRSGSPPPGPPSRRAPGQCGTAWAGDSPAIRPPMRSGIGLGLRSRAVSRVGRPTGLTM